MSWIVEQAGDDGFIRVTAKGDMDADEVFAQVREGVALIVAQALTGALIDYSGANLLMPLAAIFRMPEMFEACGLSRKTRIAVVLPEDAKTAPKYSFFDDVATNRGYTVALFRESQQALVWLRNP